MTADYLLDVFGPAGILASRVPGYEMRTGQLALTRAIDRAFTTESTVLAEGPCGSGKSFAYSVPAIYHATHCKRRVLIATANIALQEQLIRKDLPALQRLLPWPFKFAILKGRNNYACIDRLASTDAELFSTHAPDPEHDRQHSEISRWVNTTPAGDVSELPFVPAPQVWSRFSVGSDDCRGDSCPHEEDCFSNRARTAADIADIVVTNYHMLFAHISVRMVSKQDLVLPPADLVILDEAHEAADIARDFFGFTLSEYALRGLATEAFNATTSLSRAAVKRITDRIHESTIKLFSRIADYARPVGSPQIRLRHPEFVDPSGVIKALEALSEFIFPSGFRRGAVENSRSVSLGDKSKAIHRRCNDLINRLTEAVAQSDAGKVYWIEVDAKGRAKLCAKLIDVSGLLHEELFGHYKSVALTSATLTTNGNFRFVRRELGVPDEAAEVVAESPFDFGRQAMLVVPPAMPEPTAAAFTPAVCQAFRQVVQAAGGRALGLFTSHKSLNAVHESLLGCGSWDFPYRILRQGDLPRGELTRIFKEDISSVLLGTDSFWTGIDVPGEALTALVIDKLPFPSPGDPVLQAICERDPDSFTNQMIPRAIMMLRQGVGRLIRTKTDIGVVVLLDNRIDKKAYGKAFLKSLPGMRRGRIEEIREFLRGAVEMKRAIAV